MGWEARGRSGRLYYYRVSRSPDGRVVREYLGRGNKARAAAAEVERRRADEQAARQECDRLDGPARDIALLDGAVEALLEGYLLAKGYHRHNYGPWRRRRWAGK